MRHPRTRCWLLELHTGPTPSQNGQCTHTALLVLCRGRLSLKHKKASVTSSLLRSLLGNGSPFATRFHNAFVGLRQTTYRPGFNSLFSVLQPLFTQQEEQLLAQFDERLQGDSVQGVLDNLEQLMQVTHPSFRWQVSAAVSSSCVTARTALQLPDPTTG